MTLFDPTKQFLPAGQLLIPGKEYLFDYTSFDQLTTGWQMEYLRYNTEMAWESLYNGNFQVMSQGVEATIDNGLTVIDFSEAMWINWFWVASKFYQDAFTAERPTVTPQKSEEVFEPIWRAIRRAVEWYSVKGRVVLIQKKDGTVTAVNPSFYYPIRAKWDAELTIAHALVYRWTEPQKQIIYEHRVPDRARIVKFDKKLGINTVENYVLEGTVIGEKLSEEESDIENIYVFGEGERDTFYPALVPLVFELTIREAYESRLLNRHSSPIAIVPPNAGLVGPDGNSRLDPKGNTVEYEADTGTNKFGYLTWEGHLVDNREKIERLVRNIHLITGVPPVVFGIDIGKGESGQAREKLMFTAMSKVRSIRKEVELVLEEILGGDTEVSWVSSPFTTEEERRAAVLRETAVGIISINEARELLDYDEFVDAQGNPIPSPMDGGMTAQPSAGDVGSPQPNPGFRQRLRGVLTGKTLG